MGDGPKSTQAEIKQRSYELSDSKPGPLSLLTPYFIKHTPAGPRVISESWATSTNYLRRRTSPVCVSPPDHQPLNPGDTSQIVVDHRHHKSHDHYKTSKHDPFFQLGTEVTTGNTFKPHNKNVTTIQDGYR